jgi:hypothetical protein
MVLELDGSAPYKIVIWKITYHFAKERIHRLIGVNPEEFRRAWEAQVSGNFTRMFSPTSRTQKIP